MNDLQREFGRFLIDFIGRIAKKEVTIETVDISTETKLIEENEVRLAVMSTGRKVLTIKYKENDI